MNTACRRCDWTVIADDWARPAQDQLTDHAVEADHPLCVVCFTSLRPDETQTCIRCLGKCRRALATIARLWPDVLAQTPSPASQRLGDNGGKSAGTAVPGGLPAILRGAGSSGVAGALAGDDVYEMKSDGPSMQFELWRQVRDWCEVKGEPEPTWRYDIIERSAEWLEARLSWASAEHPAFDEFASEIAVLEEWVRRGSGHIEGPIKMEGRCFDCVGRDGKSVRLVKPMNADGFADDPECPRCHRVYDPGEYARAVGHHLLNHQPAA